MSQHLKFFLFLDPGIKFLRTFLQLLYSLADCNNFMETCDFPPILFLYGTVLMLPLKTYISLFQIDSVLCICVFHFKLVVVVTLW